MACSSVLTSRMVRMRSQETLFSERKASHSATVLVLKMALSRVTISTTKSVSCSASRLAARGSSAISGMPKRFANFGSSRRYSLSNTPIHLPSLHS